MPKSKDKNEQQVYSYINKNKEQLIKMAQELVRIPTVNPPGEGYLDIVKLLEKWCKQIGLKTRRINVPDSYLKKYGINKDYPRINLLANYKGSCSKVLHFNGHYDVVPPGLKKLWKTDPFEAKIIKNKIYGRGIQDMKGPMAAMLFALEAVLKTGQKPFMNIEYSFVPDEEIGGRTGFAYVVEKGIVNPDYAIGEGLGDNCVCYGNMGILWCEVEIQGKSAHASEAYKGINAFEEMVEVSRALLDLKAKIQKRKSKYILDSGKHARPTLMIGGDFEGGGKVNTVPAQARFSIDRRLIPEENISLAKKEITDCVRKAMKGRKGKYSLKFTAQDAPVIASRDSELCKTASGAIQSVYGKKARFAIEAGGTDLRFLGRKNIPFVGHSAGGLENAHKENEHVNIQDLIDSAKFYSHIILNLQE